MKTPEEQSASSTSASLGEVIRRIVDVADPQRIILFGSAARGELHAGSDIDLLVVKPGVHRRRMAQAIYRRLVGIPHSVVVVTPEDLERYRHAPGLVIAPALAEGRTVYAA